MADTENTHSHNRSDLESIGRFIAQFIFLALTGVLFWAVYTVHQNSLLASNNAGKINEIWRTIERMERSDAAQWQRIQDFATWYKQHNK